MVTSSRLQDIILPLLEGSDFELVSVKVRPVGGRIKLTVVLDHREKGISLDECTKWSRKFEDALDMQDDIPREYALDISSPGIDQPLTHIWQFKKNIGKTLKVILLDKESTPYSNSTLTVKLEGVEENTLVVDSGKQINMQDIAEARIALPW